MEALLRPAPNAPSAKLSNRIGRQVFQGVQVHLTAIAYNLKRTKNILAGPGMKSTTGLTRAVAM